RTIDRWPARHDCEARMSNSDWRRWKNLAILGLMGTSLLVCLIPLVSLLYTIVAKGARAINFRFLTSAWAPVGESGGIAHAIIGSLYLLLGASLIAVPLGLAKGLFLARRNPTKLASITRLLLDVMSGIPAIIVGVFIYTIVVRPSSYSLGTGFSTLAGSLA